METSNNQMPSANEVAASEGGTNEQKKGALLYRIDENPKLYLSFLLGFQHYLTMFGATVGLPFVLGKFLCFDAISTVMNDVLGTLFFCSGLVTLLQSTFGVRLPIVQGGTFAFIAPTAAIMALRPACPSIKATVVNATMGNGTITVGGEEAVYNEFESRMRELQGAIMISSLFQIFIGFSGMIGHVLRFIGPLTIAPTIALVGISLFQTAGFFAGTQWGIAFLTMVCIGLFSQVLKDVNVPLGCTRVQIFKLFPVLLAIIIAWVMSGILTAAGVYKEGSEARTDFRSNVLVTSKWFRFPYPGQWGLPTVTIAGVFGMLAGVLASMVESVGDYYACARLAGAQPPPKHAINRGIAIEGIGCLITGLFGTGNGTTSYSENIGAIGITRVGSIRVVQCGALFMVVLGVIAKFGAVFVTIPTPVIGGIFVIMFGMITAVGLSNLQFVDLNSMRNLFVLGVSFLLGLSLPSWVSGNQSSIDLGNDSLNQIIIVLLTTNMFVGGFSGFVLDNILPGTLEERGIIKFRKSHTTESSKTDYMLAPIETYDPPFLPQTLLSSKFAKLCPFLPYYPKPKVAENNTEL